MATLEIDGIGEVEVDDKFLTLPADQQAREVDAIAAQVRGTPAQAATGVNPPAGASVAPPISGPDGWVPSTAPTTVQTQDTPRGIGTRIMDGLKQGFGDKAVGLTEEDYKNFPGLRDQKALQVAATVVDALLRAPGAILGGAAGAVSGGAEAAGMSPANADRLMRDVGVAGQVALAPEVPMARQIPKGQVTAKEAASSIRSDASSFYKKADDAGVIIKSDSFSPLAADISTAAKRSGLDPTLTPDSVAAIKRIDEVASQPVTFQTLDTLRQIASDAQAAQKPKDRMIAGDIVRKIDEFVDKMTDKDLIAGDAETASRTIVEARDLWSKAGKLDTVARLVERAEISAPSFSASGLENSLRTEFRALAKNDRAMRTFTKEEQAAIKKIAKGTAGSNTARMGGKLAPTGPFSGALSGGFGAAVGTAIGIGPVAGAAVATGGGFAARRLATAMTKRYVENLEKTIATGGKSDMAAKSLQRGSAALTTLATIAAASAQDNQAKR